MNGYIIIRLKLPPFIVTLGSLTAVGAAPALINGGVEVSNLPPRSHDRHQRYRELVLHTFLVAVAAAVVLGLVLHRTRFGMRTFAIGSNDLGARRAGINVDAHIV